MTDKELLEMLGTDARDVSPDQIARLEALGTYPDSERYQAMKAKAVAVLPQLKAIKEEAA
jgi:hypothetical protein